MADGLPASQPWSHQGELIEVLSSRAPWVLFRHGSLPGGGLEFISPNCREVFGYGAEELLAKPEAFMRMVHQDDRDALLEALDGRDARTPNPTVRWRRADGQTVVTAVWLFPVSHDDGSPGAFEGALVEITGWAPETEPPRSLTRILHCLEDAIICVDSQDRVRFYNKGAEELFGRRTEEVVGREARKLFQDEDREGARYSFVERARDGESSTEHFWIHSKDGRGRWLCVSANPVFDGRGELEDVVVIARDVTLERAREELQTAERAHLNKLISASPAVVFTAEVGNGFDTRFITDNVRTQVGHAPEDFTEREGFWVEHVHPEDRERVLEEMARIVDEGHLVTEYRFRHADGGYRWMRDGMRLARDDQGRPREIVGSWIDITGRKEAELELDRFFTVSLDLLCIADFQGRFQRVNPAFTAILGWSEEELLGQPFRELVHPDDREQTERTTEEAVGAEIASFENRYRCKDGSYRWFLWKSVPVPEEGQIYATARDITERKDAEERLARVNQMLEDRVEERSRELRRANVRLEAELENRERAEASLRISERRYREIFEYSPLAMIQLSPDDEIVTANPAMVELLGYESLEELRSLDPSEDIFSDPGERMDLHHRLRSTGAVSAEELRWTKKGGDTIWVRVDAVAVTDEAGELRYIQGFARDITNERSLGEQLLQAQKMEAVGTLAGGVAHDFNNLLTVILANSELILAHSGSGLETREDIQDIRQAAEQGKAVTSQLLTFSRKEAVRPEEVDVNRVLGDVGRILSRLLRDDVELKVEAEAGLPRVLIDRSQLEQVIMNLVLNAQDAMPDGGPVTLRTSRVVLAEGYAATHVDAPPGPRVLLTVSDTGHGMDPKTREHIFEPFFTTKERGKGTGLGLSTVYGIVQEAGGHIGVYSEPGHGTAFKIYLPPVTTASEREEEPTRLPREELEGSETLLLIDDDEAVGRTSARVLKSFGYRVILARSSGEALERWHEDSRAIDGVITDVVLPGMRGPELAARLREDRADLGVLFMSGYANEQLLASDALTASEAFVEKPFTPMDLVRRVRELLDRREGKGA